MKKLKNKIKDEKTGKTKDIWRTNCFPVRFFFNMSGCISCQNITFKDLGITHQRFSSSKPTGILQVI